MPKARRHDCCAERSGPVALSPSSPVVSRRVPDGECKLWGFRRVLRWGADHLRVRVNTQQALAQPITDPMISKR